MTAIEDTAETLPDIDFTVDQWLSHQPSVNQAGSVDGCRHPPIGASSNKLGLEQPDSKQALKTAVFIGGAYVVGETIPLAPYAFNLSVNTALHLSIVVTCIALLIFGAVKGKVTSIPPLNGALETFMVGSLAAAVAYVLARLLTGH